MISIVCGYWTFKSIGQRNGLAKQKYESIPDWIGMPIQWELCKRLKYAFTSKWYIYIQTKIENEANKILGGFQIHMDQQIPTRILQLVKY